MFKYYTKEHMLDRFPILFVQRQELLEYWEKLYRKDISKMIKNIDQVVHVDTLRKDGHVQSDYLQILTITIAVNSYFKTRISSFIECKGSVLGECHAKALLISRLIEKHLGLFTHINFDVGHSTLHIKLDGEFYRISIDTIVKEFSNAMKAMLPDFFENDKRMGSDLGYMEEGSGSVVITPEIDVTAEEASPYVYDYAKVFLEVLREAKYPIGCMHLKRKIKDEGVMKVFRYYHTDVTEDGSINYGLADREFHAIVDRLKEREKGTNTAI